MCGDLPDTANYFERKVLSTAVGDEGGFARIWQTVRRFCINCPGVEKQDINGRRYSDCDRCSGK